jgi:hypothetical protein
LDYIQRNSAPGSAVHLELEIIISGTLEMKAEVLPDVNVGLGLGTRNPNLKILPYGFEDRPHVRIAEMHLERVAALFAGIKPKFTCHCT